MTEPQPLSIEEWYILRSAATTGRWENVTPTILAKILATCFATYYEGGFTLVHYAALWGQLDKIPTWAQEKITPDILAVNDKFYGQTMFYWAALNSKEDCIPGWIWEKAPVSCLEEVKNNPERMMKKVPPEMAAIIDRRLSAKKGGTLYPDLRVAQR